VRRVQSGGDNIRPVKEQPDVYSVGVVRVLTQTMKSDRARDDCPKSADLSFEIPIVHWSRRGMARQPP
jgi:hypothetical protein